MSVYFCPNLLHYFPVSPLVSPFNIPKYKPKPNVQFFYFYVTYYVSSAQIFNLLCCNLLYITLDPQDAPYVSTSLSTVLNTISL